MKFTWTSVLSDKQAQRDHAADRPIAEKLRVLERLRDRAAVIKRAANKASKAEQGTRQARD